MEEKIIVIQLKTGEIILTQSDDTDPFDDGSGFDTNFTIELKYPAMVIPMQNKPGQVGFQKYMPFSDYDEKMEIRREQISNLSSPQDQMRNAYEQWVTQVKAESAGIIVPK